MVFFVEIDFEFFMTFEVSYIILRLISEMESCAITLEVSTLGLKRVARKIIFKAPRKHYYSIAIRTYYYVRIFVCT